jgi:autotransporter-associated beta strand protein
MKTIVNQLKSTTVANLRWLAFLLAIIFTPSLAQAANGADTWVGNTSANFGDANWTGANIPPISLDSWVFGAAGTSGTNLNNNLTAAIGVAGITFNNGAGAFTFTNNSITLAGNVVNNSTSLETINFPISSTAVQTFTTTTGGGDISLGGVFSGIGGGITKASLGTLTLNGTAVNTYNGTTTVNGGSLIEDFTNATSAVNLIDSSSVLVLGGGALQVKQKSATATSQTFASTTVNPGFSKVTGTQVTSGALTLALGAITHNYGGSADFASPTGGAITTTSANVNGILGGWATVGNAVSSSTTGDWAANDGSGNIIPLPAGNYTTVTVNNDGTGASTQNWRNTAVMGLTASATINSLQQNVDFNVPAGVTMTLGSGGLMLKGISRWLFAEGGGNVGTSAFITSGLGTGELYVHVPNAGGTDWRIWPIIIDGAVPLQLVKDGPGFVALQNFNTYTGGTMVNGGTLALFNGGAVGAIRGTVTVNLGTTLSCTAANAFGFGVGTRVNNAVINGGTLTTSAGGDQAFNTTFNLTGGTLTSSGSSYWVLGSDTAGNGGASGINTLPSTISSVISGRLDTRSYTANGNVNEIFNVASGNTPSGLDLRVTATVLSSTLGGASGVGGITKAGTGTMLLSGANTFPGGVIGNAGTLVIGNNSALGTGLLTMNGGAISNLTGTSFIVANNVNLASATSVGVNTNDTLTLSGVITNPGGLTKVGAGTLALTGANTFTGTSTVGAGRLVLSSAQLSTSPIVVNDGTKFGVIASGASQFSPTTLTVGNSTGATLEFTVSSTTLAPLTPGTLTLNGANTINVVGGSLVAGNSYPLLTYTTVSGAGTLTLGTLPGGVTGNVTLIGNTYTLNVTAVANIVWTGATNGTWDINSTANWLISGVAGVYLDGAQVLFDDTGLNTTTITNLPGTLLSPAGITVNNTATNYAIKTVIVGTGGITKSGTGILTNTAANTYSGPTVINGGVVQAGVASVGNVSGALGNNSAVSLANDASAALNITGFNTQLGSLTGGGTTGGNVILGTQTLTVGGDNTSPAAYNGMISGTGGLTKIGTGAFSLSGSNIYTGNTTVGGGTLNLTGNPGLTGGLFANGGGTLNLSGTFGVGAVNNVFIIGQTAGKGVLNIPAGVTLGRANLFLGDAVGTMGAVYQTGGSLTLSQAAGIDPLRVGSSAGGLGYYKLSGGSVTATRPAIGASLDNTVGVFDVTGGTLTTSDRIDIAAGGSGGGLSSSGTLNVMGGTVNVGTDIRMLTQAGGTAGGVARLAVLNVGGGAGAVSVTTGNSATLGVNLAQAGNVAGNLGVVNLLTNGTLTTSRILGSTVVNPTTLFNFNGGTLKANPIVANPLFNDLGPDAIYIYANGGTIDDSGTTLIIDKPLLAPTDSGVTGIAVTTGGSGYLGAPMVLITGGTGIGATAFANMVDDGTGKGTFAINSITITSPGVYTAAPTTVTLRGGGASVAATIGAISTGANSSGGLTKVGNGTLTLSGANTYTGTTRVAGGTLSLNPLLSSLAGPLTVTNAALAVDASSGSPMPLGNLTLQNNATNNLSYGTLSVNPTTPAITAGNISATGSGIVINVSGFGLKLGQFPLITYTGALSGFANLSLGPLPPGVVGTLSNNVASSSIDIVITSTSQDLAWYGLLPDGVTVSSNWDITLTTNWVAVGTTTPALRYQEYTSAGITAGDTVTFDDSLFSNGGNPVTSINITTPVRPFRVLANNTQPYTLSSSSSIANGLAGIGSMVKQNSGSLTLLTSNSFAGGLSITGGSVIITNDFSLGVATKLVALNGGSLQINNNTTNAVRPFSLTGASVIGVAAGANARFGGVFSGSGGLTKVDDGTLTLAGVNTYAGNTFVRAGTLVVDSGGVINVSATVYSSIGQLAGDNGTLTLKGTGIFNEGFDFNVADIGDAVGTLNIQDTAILNAFNLFISSANAAGSTASGTVNQTGGTVNQTNPAAGFFVIGGRNTASALGVGVYNLSGGTVNASSDVRVGANGTGTVNQSGGLFNATLGGINLARLAGGVGTYNLNGGTLQTLNVASTIGVNSVFNFNGGTLKAAANNPAFFLGLSRAYVRDGGAVIDTTNFNISIDQPLLQSTNVADVGTGGLTKLGTGTLTLSGVNTFGGAITVKGGTLLLNGASIYAGAVNVSAGTNFGTNFSFGTLSMTTASKFTGPTTVTNGATFIINQVGSGTSSISNLTVGVSATATNSATLGLGFSGATTVGALVNAGTLTFNGTNTISLVGALQVGTIPLVKYVGALAGSGTFTNLTLPQGATGFISNSVSDSTLYAVITSAGPGLVWRGPNSVPALVNLWDINSTTNWVIGSTPTSYRQPVIPGDAVTFDDSGSGTVILNTNVAPSSLVISNNSTSYTFRGIGTISGPTGLQKLGSGTAILNLTNNTYTGDTAISNGTLQVGSAAAIPSSASSGKLVISSTGTLNLAGFSETISGLSGSGLIDNASATAPVLTMGSGNGAINWSGTITNTGTGGISIIKVGTGNSIITGTNYLTSAAASQVNAGTMLITNGGALHLSGNAEFWVMQNAGTATVIVDGGTLDVANNWLVVGRNNAAANGTLILNSGLIQKNGGGNVVVGSLNATGTLIVNGGQLLNNSELWLGESPAAVATLYLNGGLIQATQVRQNNNGGLPTTLGTAYFNGGTLQASASSANFLQGTIISMVMSNGLILDDGGFTLSIGASALQAGDAFNGGLVKQGAGTVYLDAANSYTGTTLVTNGTLAGIGNVSGPMIVRPAGNLGAGDAGAAVGTFTIYNNLTLQGNATLRIDKTGGSPVQDNVTVSGNITYGGILTVNNITSDANLLTTTNTFQLFSVSGSTSGNFSSIVGSPGAGLAYSFTPASGVLSVVTGTTIASNPTNITFSVSGSTLSLSWPADHLGWLLQSQTNSLSTGISTNWFDVPGSASSTSAVINMNPDNATVFYRLRHP